MNAPTMHAPDPHTAPDRRGSWIPTGPMITTRLMELRRRRGLMIAMGVVLIGLPSLFLIVRLIMHAVDPKSYGPAGGADVFQELVAGVLYTFGFIMAATLGCTAGAVDLSEGMFRHLVVTGRSRLALYLARIPAGLAIVASFVAVGFAIVCLVCTFAAPKTVSLGPLTLRAGLSQAAFDKFAIEHPAQFFCNVGYQGPVNVPIECGTHLSDDHVVTTAPAGSGIVVTHPITKAALDVIILRAAHENYSAYKNTFLKPPLRLMVRSGLWILLEAAIGFVVGLGLASLTGQRTVSVVLLLILEVVLTPIFSRVAIPHLINVQRGIVGLATAHLEPSGLPRVLGDGGGSDHLVYETRGVAIFVICAWLVGWTALGAWRMMTRDA